MNTTGKLCPLSPTRMHRVYYSARRHGVTAPVGRGATCRDCSVEVYFVGGGWQSTPPGEILVGLMAEFQARMMEGDPDGIQNPRGIFGCAVVESDVVTELDRMIQPINLGRVSLLPPFPSILS